MAHRLSCPKACGVFLDPGIEPVSPALASGFLTTGLAEVPSIASGTYSKQALTCHSMRAIQCYFKSPNQSLLLSLTYQLSLTLLEDESESRSVISDSFRPQGLYSPWNSGQNTGVGSRSLLQGIFPTQRLNRGLLHCRWILYQLSYQGINRIKCKLPRRAF